MGMDSNLCSYSIKNRHVAFTHAVVNPFYVTSLLPCLRTPDVKIESAANSNGILISYNQTR